MFLRPFLNQENVQYEELSQIGIYEVSLIIIITTLGNKINQNLNRTDSIRNADSGSGIRIILD